MNLILGKIIKNRYIIGVIVIVFFTFFKLSGSSIDMWNQYLNDGEIIDSVICGKERGIRSDEWAVFTPMALSQVESGFNYYSDVLRGTKTDMYIEYGQPVNDIALVFKPFQIGYIILKNAEYGLAFYWISRIVALILVSYEFGLLFLKTKGQTEIYQNSTKGLIG